MELEEINSILKELQNTHLSAGPLYEKVNACKALINSENDDLEVIYNLTESHSPGLRDKTVYRYEKILIDESKDLRNLAQLEKSKDSLTIKCSMYPKKKKIEEMLKHIEEMPKEWSVVQMTPQYNPMEVWNEDKNIYYTNSIHITVFHCGTKDEPFFVTANAPRDPVNGEIVELNQEMISILKANKEVLTSHGEKKMFASLKEKHKYLDSAQGVEDRLQLLIRDLQKLWLKEWRCLLTGKYCDSNLESQIKEEITTSFKNEAADLTLTKKVQTILCSIVKNYVHLKLNEVKNIIQYCFPQIEDRNLLRNLVNNIRAVGEKFFAENAKAKRHPVIIILHDSLDCFPWEMIDVLQDQPVSRLPSVHFLYCLFTEHQHDIVDGYKIQKYEKGGYVVNPDLDLTKMETRMSTFFKYWTPNWTGFSGQKPFKDEFFDLITSCDVFSYNGHGSGIHLVPIEKFQKSYIKAVVLLSGCGSTKLVRTDPQTDMFGHYHLYLIARCPCVIGMLWEVTDKATDELSTEFMSYWIPSTAPKHWKYVDKTKWLKGDQKVHIKNQPILEDDLTWEPDLLNALLLAKKHQSNVMTKAACVIRGLPVKNKI